MFSSQRVFQPTLSSPFSGICKIHELLLVLTIMYFVSCISITNLCSLQQVNKSSQRACSIFLMNGWIHRIVLFLEWRNVLFWERGLQVIGLWILKAFVCLEHWRPILDFFLFIFLRFFFPTKLWDEFLILWLSTQCQIIANKLAPSMNNTWPLWC